MIPIVRGTARVAPRVQQAVQRRFMGGDGHHPHNVFEPPFSKVFVGGLVGGGVFAGIALIVGSWKFQNAKHGFTDAK